MIRWALDSIAHGPLVRVRIRAGITNGLAPVVGVLILTPAERDDLARRLAQAPAGNRYPCTRYPCTRCGAAAERGAALCSACIGGADLHEGMHAEPGDDLAPLPAGVDGFPCGCAAELEPAEGEGPDIVAPDGSVA